MSRRTRYAMAFVAITGVLGFVLAGSRERAVQAPPQVQPPGQPNAQPNVRLPVFEVDANWPNMPEKWALGQVGGIAVDAQDHVWISNRPSSIDEQDLLGAKGIADCCVPAPAVLEFDEKGAYVQGWGGPSPTREYEWMKRGGVEKRTAGDARAENGEHGVYVDYKGNVWVGGNGDGDAQILKFTRAGKFLMQIGHQGQSKGSNDTQNVNRSTGYFVWPQTNELFVSDGYGNRRVIVFDAETGAYKRHWGAYGNRPDDSAPRDRTASGPPPQQMNTVHGITLSNDGLVYVADRVNDRVQVFNLDGTFVKEAFISRHTTEGPGTAFGMALSSDPQQQFLYVADGTNAHIVIMDRKTLQILGSFGRYGRNSGQFFHLHSITSDSKGNIYTGESLGMRAQKFVFKGLSAQTSASTAR